MIIQRIQHHKTKSKPCHSHPQQHAYGNKPAPYEPPPGLLPNDTIVQTLAPPHQWPLWHRHGLWYDPTFRSAQVPLFSILLTINLIKDLLLGWPRDMNNLVRKNGMWMWDRIKPSDVSLWRLHTSHSCEHKVLRCQHMINMVRITKDYLR